MDEGKGASRSKVNDMQRRRAVDDEWRISDACVETPKDDGKCESGSPSG